MHHLPLTSGSPSPSTPSRVVEQGDKYSYLELLQSFQVGRGEILSFLI
jgi:hypothetical protein